LSPALFRPRLISTRTVISLRVINDYVQQTYMKLEAVVVASALDDM